ncbi:MAG: hypothetical protein P1U40_04930 [Coxiellaceae bacterium]|nr:hypothetical protein [Coxiellaceae bacterium]
MDIQNTAIKKPWYLPRAKTLKPSHTLSGSTAALQESTRFVSGDCVGGPVNK